MGTRRNRLIVFFAAFAFVATVAIGVALTSGSPAEVPAQDPVPAGGVPDAVQPAPWDLSTPESAVRSYLDWVSFSYRMVNSDIPVSTMTPEEAIRVDAYIELNSQDGLALDQHLIGFDIRSESIEGTSAVLAAHEDWEYRYFTIETLSYSTDMLTASYETTYTLIAGDEGWLVDTVEAEPLGKVE